MDATVIIPTHNRRAWVLRAVAALLRQTHPLDSYEIIVSCDRCTDGTAESLRAAFGERVRLLSSDMPGPSGALNTALRHARGELAIILDDEMEADEDLVAAHIQAHRTNLGTPVVVTGYSSVILDADATPYARSVARDYENYFSELRLRVGQGTPGDLCGSNFSASVAALAGVGGYSESYVFQRNDFELGVRMLRAGYEIRFCGSAKARQRLAITADTVIGRTAERARNDCRLAIQYPWCVPDLPFYRAVTNRSVRRRWRVLWEVSSVAAALFRIARLVLPESLWLANMEYATRYCMGLRKEMGSWRALCQLYEIS